MKKFLHEHGFVTVAAIAVILALAIIGPLSILTKQGTQNVTNTFVNNGQTDNEYNINYETNGGEIDDPNPSYEDGKGTYLPTPHRLGYIFDGWYFESDFSGERIYAITVEEVADKTVYAKWIPITYTVVFTKNGGEGEMANITLTYDEPANLPTVAFTRTLFSFVGWSLGASSDVSFANGQEVVNLATEQDATVILSANWRWTDAYFDKGSVVNNKLTGLAGGKQNITAVKRTNSVKPGFVPSEANTISPDLASYEVYAWFDNGTIYWFCSAEKVYYFMDSAGFYSGFYNMKELDVTGVDTSRIQNMDSFLNGCAKLEYLNMSNFNTLSVTSKNNLFNGCQHLETVNIGINCNIQDKLPIPSPTYIVGAVGKWIATNSMTYDPEDIPVGVADTYYASSSMIPPLMAARSDWYTSPTDGSVITTILCLNNYSITGLEDESWAMDAERLGTIMCYRIGETLYIVNRSGYSSSSGSMLLASDISGMFAQFPNLQTVTGAELFNTVKVTKASNLFGYPNGQGCTKLKRFEGYQKWNMSNLEEVDYMFNQCALEEIDISSWNLESVTSLSHMFDGALCSNIVMKNADTARVARADYTFANCPNLKSINIYKFKTNILSTTVGMFSNNPELTTISVDNNIDFSHVSVSTNMFLGSESLFGGYNTTYDANHIDKEYARIDKAVQAGYFNLYDENTPIVLAKLYEKAFVSNSFDVLTAAGVTAKPWDYRDGARLLEINISNLKVGKANVVRVTVPVGMYFVEDRWTTTTNAAVTNARLVSLDLSSDAGLQQGTGSYSNSLVGTLEFTIDSSATAVTLQAEINIDKVIWNYGANNGPLTQDPVVTVQVDNGQIVKINDVISSRSLGGNTSKEGVSYSGTTNSFFYIDTKTQKLCTSPFYLLSADQSSVSFFFKSVDVYASVIGVNRDGERIYATISDMGQTFAGMPLDNDNGLYHIHVDNIYTSGASPKFNPVVLIDAATGFYGGSKATVTANMICVDYNNVTHNYTRTYTVDIRANELDYSKIVVGGANGTVPKRSWHGDDNYNDCLAYFTMSYSGIVNATDVHLLYQYDINTAEGSTPAILVRGARVACPKNVTINATIYLVDENGTFYGPFNASGKSTAHTSGVWFSAAKIASDNGVSQTAYIKSIEYTISSVPGASTQTNFYSSGGAKGPTSAGTFVGQALRSSSSKLTVSFPDGTASKSKTVSTSITNSPTTSTYINHSGASGSSAPSFPDGTTLVAGGSPIRLGLNCGEQTYPYGNTNHIHHPVLFIALPLHVSVDSATLSTTSFGTSVAELEISIVKQVVEDGVVYNIYKITTVEPYSYGMYTVSNTGTGTSNATRWFNLTISANSDADAAVLYLKNNLFFSDANAMTAVGGSYQAYKVADRYDLNGNGKTNDYYGTIKSETVAITITK